MRVALYLHSKGIVHWDFKLDNILVIDEKFTVKVIDFGLSKNCVKYEMSTNCGTEGLAAPELFLNLEYTPKVDVYSIGCMLD